MMTIIIVIIIIIFIMIIIFIIIITLIIIKVEYISFFIEDGELQAAEMKLHPILIKTLTPSKE